VLLKSKLCFHMHVGCACQAHVIHSRNITTNLTRTIYTSHSSFFLFFYLSTLQCTCCVPLVYTTSIRLWNTTTCSVTKRICCIQCGKASTTALNHPFSPVFVLFCPVFDTLYNTVHFLVCLPYVYAPFLYVIQYVPSILYKLLLL